MRRKYANVLQPPLKDTGSLPSLKVQSFNTQLSTGFDEIDIAPDFEHMQGEDVFIDVPETDKFQVVNI